MFVLAPASIALGVLLEPREYRLVGLGIALETLGVVSMVFWRKVQANRIIKREEPADTN